MWITITLIVTLVMIRDRGVTNFSLLYLLLNLNPIDYSGQDFFLARGVEDCILVIAGFKLLKLDWKSFTITCCALFSAITNSLIYFQPWNSLIENYSPYVYYEQINYILAQILLGMLWIDKPFRDYKWVVWISNKWERIHEKINTNRNLNHSVSNGVLHSSILGLYQPFEG